MGARILNLVLMAVSFFGGGCCTVMSGNYQTIPVSSTPQGATVTCETGGTAVTPGTLTLSTKKVHTLVFRHPDYEVQQVFIEKKLNNWVFANILWDFGIITIPIDLISGAINELQPKQVHVDFVMHERAMRFMDPGSGTSTGVRESEDP